MDGHRPHQAHDDVVGTWSERFRHHVVEVDARYGGLGVDRPRGVGEDLADVGDVGSGHADRRELDLLAERLEHPPVGVTDQSGRSVRGCWWGAVGWTCRHHRETVARRRGIDGLDRPVGATEQRHGRLPHLATGASGAKVERRAFVPDGRSDERGRRMHHIADRRELASVRMLEEAAGAE